MNSKYGYEWFGPGVQDEKAVALLHEALNLCEVVKCAISIGGVADTLTPNLTYVQPGILAATSQRILFAGRHTHTAVPYSSFSKAEHTVYRDNDGKIKAELMLDRRFTNIESDAAKKFAHCINTYKQDMYKSELVDTVAYSTRSKWQALKRAVIAIATIIAIVFGSVLGFWQWLRPFLGLE